MSSSSNTDRSTGRVKWFNNKSGFGFITVMVDDVEKDVFIHHSAIEVDKQQYKYLVQGEYVEFTYCKSNTETHELQAGTVRGINGGKLMCETHQENRPTGAVQSRSNRPHVNVRGGGPRDDNTEWLLVRRNRQNGGTSERSVRRGRDM